MKGQFGPYIKYKTINATIPDDKDPNDITMEEALVYIDKRLSELTIEEINYMFVSKKISYLPVLKSGGRELDVVLSRKKYFELRMAKKTTGIEKPHMLKDLRSDIARCLTVLGSKQK